MQSISSSARFSYARTGSDLRMSTREVKLLPRRCQSCRIRATSTPVPWSSSRPARSCATRANQRHIAWRIHGRRTELHIFPPYWTALGQSTSTHRRTGTYSQKGCMMMSPPSPLLGGRKPPRADDANLGRSQFVMSWPRRRKRPNLRGVARQPRSKLEILSVPPGTY